MNKLSIVLLLVVAALTSFLTATFMQRDSTSALAEKNDSVYERVLRTGTIRCGYWTWPPFLVIDPNTKQMKGPTYDYMQAVGKTLGLKVEWVMEVGVGELVSALDTDRFDVMCMSVWPEEARLKNTLMTRPVFYSAVYPTVRADDTRFDTSFDSLNSSAVTAAIIDADTSLSIALDRLPEAKLLSLPQQSDSSQLMASVASGKADVTFLDEGVVSDYNAANDNTLKLIKTFGPTKVFPEVLIVKRGETALKTLLDSAIDVLDSDNYAARILAPYHISSYPPQVPYDIDFRSKPR